MSVVHLTFAELQFIVSIVPNAQLDLAGQLGFGPDHADALQNSGLASLVVRRGCGIAQDNVTFTGDLAEVTNSLGGATVGLRVAVVSETNVTIWQIFASDQHRLLIMPIGHGLFDCQPMIIEYDLVAQAVDLIDATLDDSSESIVIECFRHAETSGLILDLDGADWVDRESRDAGFARSTVADHLSRLVTSSG